MTQSYQLKQDQFLIMYPDEHKLIFELAQQNNIQIKENSFEINFNQLQESFFNKTGFQIIQNRSFTQKYNGKIEVVDHASLIKNKMVPFDIDHDLIIHVLPTVATPFCLKELYSDLSNIEDPIVRAVTFELIFTMSFVSLLDGDKRLDSYLSDKMILKYLKKNGSSLKESDIYISTEFMKKAVSMYKEAFTSV